MNIAGNGYGNFFIFSVQQLVACDYEKIEHGCDSSRRVIQAWVLFLLLPPVSRYHRSWLVQPRRLLLLVLVLLLLLLPRLLWKHYGCSCEESVHTVLATRYTDHQT